MWQEAEATKMRQLLKYETFLDKGIAGNLLSGYKRICDHMISDVKHDFRHIAQLVAGRHLTDPIRKAYTLVFNC
jgi:hypothetical protein